MNLIFHLLSKFFKEEYITTIMILITSILVNIIQTSSISSITANIINTVKEGQPTEIYALLQSFVGFSLLFLFVFYLYKLFQNKLVTKLLQWIRLELATLVMKHNNEDFSDKNFIKLNAPVNRISSVCFMFVSDLFTFILPIMAFIIVICGYFTYHDPLMGSIFILLNIIILTYTYFILPSIIRKNEEYEKQFTDNESYFLEILNNMDKIVYRGQTKNEIQEYKTKIKKTIEKSHIFYSYMNNQATFISVFIYFIIFAFLYYNTNKIIHKEMSIVLYITFITIILLYRDKMAVFSQQIVDFVEFSGRANGVLEHFKDIQYEFQPFYENKELEFNKITFQNVFFKYRTKNEYAVNNLSLEFHLNNKIIGITGKSGRGKSTFMKLLLKMYKEYKGDIFIDDVNIRELDPDYIRKNIVFVNQNSKLFDRLIVENMMYGCSKESSCNNHLEKIMKTYPKIRELFRENDIYSTMVGSLGEKMSGGQRVVISIITGLITPSVGLILDEPTNGLDGILKNEILQLIQSYKKHKKFIFIITHDKDVYRILDERKEL
jgi:ATP-binding cassette subfamily B protein